VAAAIARPVQRVVWPGVAERQCDHAIDQRRQTGLSGLVAQQASHTLAHEPLWPAPYARL